MADTIQTPVGRHSKLAVYGVVGAVVIGAALWYRTHKSSSAAASSSTTAAADTTGIDPATGYPYGSPEDQAALAAMGSGYGAGYPGSGGSSSGAPVPGGFTTNAQWSQAAEAALVSNGADPQTVGNALGKYITGQAVTSDQQAVIEQAIAFEGFPPVAGPNGFPPSIQAASGGGGGGGSAANPVTGLHASNIGKTGADVHWNAAAAATGYQVFVDGQLKHSVTGTSTRVGSLHQRHRYTVSVLAQPAASGAQKASVTFTTK